MRKLLWILPVIAASGCLRTRIEVVTEVGVAGDGLRTVIIVSEDDGKPAEHPRSLRVPGAAYSVVERGTGTLRAVGAFSDLNQAPPPFSFRLAATERSSGGGIQYRTRDWVLFTQCSYRETVTDAVDLDDIKAALDETAATLLSLTESTLVELLGEDFEATQLRKRLRGDLRELAREAVFMTWQEMVEPAGDAALQRWASRFTSIARKYGLELQPAWIESALLEGEGGEEQRFETLQAQLAVRRALADWLAEGLQPVRRGDRVPMVTDLDTILFGGAFAMEFDRQAEKRFGAGTRFADWFEAMQERIFGLFGPFGSGSAIEFTYRVKMPGDLISTNGFLSRDGWVFVHFTQDRIYPMGAGVECQSVVWDYGVTSVLPGAGVVPDNEAAIEWTFLLGEGPASEPDSVLAEEIRRCAEQRSLEPLRELASRQQVDPPRRKKAEALLAWLEGQRG